MLTSISSKKTHENTSNSSKNEFICSFFFWRILGLAICFWNQLNFNIGISILCKMDCLWKFSHSSKVCRPWHPFSFHGSLFFFAFPIGWIDFHINIFWQIWIKKCPLQFGKYILHSSIVKKGRIRPPWGQGFFKVAFRFFLKRRFLCP